MKIVPTRNGYEATGSIGQGLTKVSFIGFGTTNVEALRRCFGKIHDFMRTPYKESIEDQMDDDSDKVAEYNGNIPKGYTSDNL